MSLGSLKVNLRPLRLAFLVDPADDAAVLQAIETSTFLWGGAFNPIVPVFHRLPKAWKRERLDVVKPRSVLDGYLDAFDPDLVVLVGALESRKLDVGHRETIKCSEILKDVAEDGTPAYGIGLFELLDHFAERELKFVRHSPAQLCLPEIGRKSRLFLASVFGLLPDQLGAAFQQRFGALPGLQTKPCSVDNYIEFLQPESLFLRRLGCWHLRPVRYGFSRNDCVFFMDADSTLDVLDYWNLRALGWTVIPVCRQSASNVAVRNFAQVFVEENSFAYRSNPELFNHTVLLRGRSATLAEVRAFGQSLGLKPKRHQNEWKMTYQDWQPRVWDEWAREKDGAEPCVLEVKEEEFDLSGDETRFAFKTLMPEFASRFGGHHEPRCANDLGLRLWSKEQLLAEVMPEGDERAARSMGALGLKEWRCSKMGLVHLVRHKNWRQTLEYPNAEAVFSSWLSERGWKTELSDKGHIAEQMLKHLGGSSGTRVLARDGIIQLLEKLSNGRTLNVQAFRADLAKIAGQDKFKVLDSDRLAHRLVEAQMVQLGLDLQCTRCRQHSWYSLREVDYDLQCPKCLQRFRVPTHSPKEMVWAYRGMGPFSLPQQAYGVYSVLLTLRFFANPLRGATTPMLSFTAKKDATHFEADLALFFRASKFRERRTELVFAECKTFNEFEPRDAQRMTAIGREFPGATLVFATLRRTLADKERRLLHPVVNRGRKYWKAERPYNPVIILTGNELFADFDVWETWRELGGIHAAHSRPHGEWSELVSLADATQQIYLGMKPWHSWLEERWKRRVSRLAVKHPTQVPNTTSKPSPTNSDMQAPQ